MDFDDQIGMVDDLERWVKQVNEESSPDGTDLWDVARLTVHAMPSDDVAKAALLWLVSTVRARRRNQTHQIEQAATVRPRRRPTAAERAEREEERYQDLMRFGGQVAKIMEEYAAEKFTEWTQELLESRFALPDGSTVEWGAATIDDHRQRVEMFQGYAEASIEGGARHQQAIDALTESGAECLNEYIRRE